MFATVQARAAAMPGVLTGVVRRRLRGKQSAAQGPVIAPVGGSAAQSPEATNTSLFFAELSQLMTWRTQGFHSDAEFVEAKQRLGL